MELECNLEWESKIYYPIFQDTSHRTKKAFPNTTSNSNNLASSTPTRGQLLGIIKMHRTIVTRVRTSKLALTTTQSMTETVSLYPMAHRRPKIGITSSGSRKTNLKMQTTKSLQTLPRTNPKTRRKMRRREMSQTRMMMMRTKAMPKKSKKSQRSQGTFLHEGYPIHSRRLLRSRSSSCRLGKTLWQSIQIFPRIGSSRTSLSH